MLRRFRDDRKGVAAVEFALIAPIMLAMYFGLAELTLAMMAERRASHAASVVADLVAQSTQVNAAQVTDIFTVGGVILKPLPAAPLKMRITSVKADAAGSPMVIWSQGNGLTALAAGGTPTGFPTGLLAVGDSVIMAEAAYTYTSPLQQLMPDPVTFNRKFYLRPRKSAEVSWSTG
jgi:Flp pilus assembly protein TadG